MGFQALKTCRIFQKHRNKFMQNWFKTKINTACFFTILALPLFFGCVTTTTSAGNVGADRNQLMIVSEEQMEQSAKESYAKVLAEAKNNGTLNLDSATVKRVKTVAQNLIKQTGTFREDAPGWDWQINVIDRKNDNMNLNKAEKVEIVAKINSFNSQNQQYESNIVKMNYNEFQEVLNNFKKIDGQLHLFKQ